MSEVSLIVTEESDGTNSRQQSVIALTPEEELAGLRRLVSEKDHAVIRAVVSVDELQQQLEHSKAESMALRAQLEVAREKPQAAIQAAVNGEVLKLTAKFNQARKGLEREYSKVRSELVTLRAQSQQLQHQLESERRSRQLDAVRAAGKIASLEKDLAAAYGERAESGKAAERGRAVRLRLLAAAAVAALVAVIFGWSLMNTAVKPAVAADTSRRETRVARPQAAIPNGSSPSREFQSALLRLNVALANYPEMQPEDVLNGVRNRMSGIDPTVCAFEWNGGQPALLYGGQTKSVSLASTLTKCAQAVEKARLD